MPPLRLDYKYVSKLMKEVHQSVINIGLVMVIMSLVVMSSCRKDEVFAGDRAQLSFSTDTLTFDTVFTQVGSATRSFKIYNKESSDVTVDVSVGDPTRTFFRLNVDGIAGTSVENVRIGANDSIYVFADVTVDPDNPLSISPFVIEEDLLITSGNTSEKVQLVAWGQNANYVGGTDGNGKVFQLTCENGMALWDDPKPYVIYGILFVNECLLTIPAGTDVYVHGGVVVRDTVIYNDGFLIATNTGTIICEGTADAPVTFQGDRLEDAFDDRAGQWVGIRLLAQSRGNRFSHTKIKNSSVGIFADSLSSLSLESCEIKNTTGSGLVGIYADITASNTLIYENGQNAVTLAQGGNYDFTYCTFTSYGNQLPALSMFNYREYFVEDGDNFFIAQPLSARITNTIITGNDTDEISLDDITDGEAGFFDFEFDHCAVTVEDLLANDAWPNFFDNCNECVRARFGDAIFADIDQPDYRPDTLSILEMQATPLPSIFEDLDGNTRDATNPDIGCYEYQN